MRIYISGPMGSSSEEDTRERFYAAEGYLRSRGYKVFNPARYRWLLRHFSYRHALSLDVFMMSFCSGIFLLEGWTESAAAMTEHRFAISTGMVVYYEK